MKTYKVTFKFHPIVKIVEAEDEATAEFYANKLAVEDAPMPNESATEVEEVEE